MSTLALIAEHGPSQAPALQQYAYRLNEMWQASRHPGNWEEIKDSVSENLAEETPARKVAIGTGVAVLGVANTLELSPANETGYAKIAGNVFRHTADLLPDIANSTSIPGMHRLASDALISIWNGINEFLPAGGAVGTSAAIWEGAIGLGVAVAIKRFRGTVDLIYRRYLPQPKEADIEDAGNKSSRLKRWLGRWGLAATTGAAGTTVVEDVRYRLEHDEPREEVDTETPRNSGILLGINNGLLTVGILKVGSIIAKNGFDQENPVETVADVVSHPLIMGGVFTGIFGALWLKERRQIAANVRARVENETPVSVEEQSAPL